MSKLSDIINEAHNQSADLLISDDFKDDKVRAKAKANYQEHTKQQIKDLFNELIKDSTDWDEGPDGQLYSELNEDKLRQKVNEL